MELEHSFTVPVPKERAWDVLLDVERVAPCMPGTTLDSVDGDKITGKIKVKVGPISMTYAGKAEIVERDEQAGVVRLAASGKETRGAGTASASVRSVLEDRGAETHVTVLTTLNVTGKPAQFGRGVMNEVSGKLLSIFASNLAAMLSESDEGDSGASDGAPAVADAPAVAGAPTADATPATADAAPAMADAVPVAADAADAAAGVAGVASVKADSAVDDLHLNARAVAALHREGITTVGQLAAKTADELLAIDGIGPASVEEITAKLGQSGLALASPAGSAERSRSAGPAQAASTSVESAAATVGAGAGTNAGAGSGANAGAGAGASAPPSASTAAANGHGARTGATASAKPPRRKGNQDDSLNLLRVAGVPVLKRSIPVLAGVTAVLIIGWRRKVHRRSSSSSGSSSSSSPS